jgi:hypothetical protein
VAEVMNSATCAAGAGRPGLPRIIPTAAGNSTGRTRRQLTSSPPWEDIKIEFDMSAIKRKNNLARWKGNLLVYPRLQ